MDFEKLLIFSTVSFLFISCASNAILPVDDAPQSFLQARQKDGSPVNPVYEQSKKANNAPTAKAGLVIITEIDDRSVVRQSNISKHSVETRQVVRQADNSATPVKNNAVEDIEKKTRNEVVVQSNSISNNSASKPIVDSNLEVAPRGLAKAGMKTLNDDVKVNFKDYVSNTVSESGAKDSKKSVNVASAGLESIKLESKENMVQYISRTLGVE